MDISILVVGVALLAPPAFLVGIAAFVLATMGRTRGPEDTFFIAYFRRLNSLYARWWHRLRFDAARDPLPPQGSCIVVANHRSGVDPILIAALTIRWIHFLMAREYYEARGMRWFFRGLGCIPVSRDGKDFAATRTSLEGLRRGHVIGIFPQGGIRDSDDVLSDGKEGVALLALRSGAPVVPLYVHDSPTHDSPFRVLLRRSRTRVTCGAPLRFVAARGKPDRGETSRVTAEILQAIHALRDAPERATSDIDAPPPTSCTHEGIATIDPSSAGAPPAPSRGR